MNSKSCCYVNLEDTWKKHTIEEYTPPVTMSLPQWQNYVASGLNNLYGSGGVIPGGTVNTGWGGGGAVYKGHVRQGYGGFGCCS